MGKKVAKGYLWGQLLLGTLLFLSALLTSGAACAQESVLLTNGEWPPYLSPTFRHGGLLSRITSEAFAEAGLKVEYDYLPWKRALSLGESAPYAGSIAWRKLGGMDERFYYSDPLIVDDIVFFHRKGKDFNWDDLAEISTLRVGLSLGYLYNEPIKQAARKHGGEIDIAPTELLCFQKLLLNRVDVVPASINVGYYLLQTNFVRGQASTITHAPKEFLSDTLHLLISRKHPKGQELIERFNRGLKVLKEDGRYDQYLDESLRGEYQP